MPDDIIASKVSQMILICNNIWDLVVYLKMHLISLYPNFIFILSYPKRSGCQIKTLELRYQSLCRSELKNQLYHFLEQAFNVSKYLFAHP